MLDAIGFVALAGFGTVQYDFMAPPWQRLQSELKRIDIWRAARRPSDQSFEETPLNRERDAAARRRSRLLGARDHRRVLLRE